MASDAMAEPDPMSSRRRGPNLRVFCKSGETMYSARLLCNWNRCLVKNVSKKARMLGSSTGYRVSSSDTASLGRLMIS
jgi:hypothetical protein